MAETIIFDGALSPVGTLASVAVSSATWASNVGTVTLAAALSTIGLVSGSIVSVYNVNSTGMSIAGATITSTGTNSFTYPTPGTSGSGTATIGTGACVTIGDAASGLPQCGNVGWVTAGGTTSSANPLFKFVDGRYKIGDSTPANRGWSADIRNQADHTAYCGFSYDLTSSPGSAAATACEAICDYWFGDFSNSFTGFTNILELAYPSGSTPVGPNVSSFLAIRVSNTGLVSVAFRNSGLGGNTSLLLPGSGVGNNGWVRFGAAAVLTSGTSWNMVVAYQFPGGTAWIPLFTYSATNNVVSSIGSVHLGIMPISGGSSPYWMHARISRPIVGSLGAIADFTNQVLPNGYVDPVPRPCDLNVNNVATAARTNWFSTNPSTLVALATNDGATSATPTTFTDALSRTANCGYLPAAPAFNTAVNPLTGTVTGYGDVFIFDSSVTSAKTNGVVAMWQTNGAYMIPPATEIVSRIMPASPLSAWGTTAQSNVFAATAVDATQLAMVWQDDGNNCVPLALATSDANAQSIPGSYWNASTTKTDVNPIGGVEPSSTPQYTFWASYNLSGASSQGNAAAFQICADGCYFQGIESDFTANKAGGTTQPNDCISDGANPNTPSTITNLHIANGRFGLRGGGNRHLAGFIMWGTNSNYLLSDGDWGSMVNSGFGSQSTFVCQFSSTATGCTFTSRRNRCLAGLQVPGSSNAAATFLAFTSHYSSTGSVQGNATFDADNMPNGWISGQGTFNSLIFKNGATYAYATAAEAIVSTQSYWTQGPPTSLTSCLVSDSIINFSGNTTSNYFATTSSVAGPLSFIGVDFVNNGTIATHSVIDCTNATSLTVRNCTFTDNNPGALQSWFANIPSNCPVVFDDNEYRGFTATATLIQAFAGAGNQTVAQWRALGYDTRSQFQGIDAGFTMAKSTSFPYSRTGAGIRTWNRGAVRDRNSVQYSNVPVVYQTFDPVIYISRNDAGSDQYKPALGLGSGGGMTSFPFSVTSSSITSTLALVGASFSPVGLTSRISFEVANPGAVPLTVYLYGQLSSTAQWVLLRTWTSNNAFEDCSMDLAANYYALEFQASQTHGGNASATFSGAVNG